VLEAAGHCVEEAAPRALLEYEERSAWGALLGVGRYRECLAELAERLDRPVGPEDVEPFLWALATDAGDAIHPADLERAIAWEREWSARVLVWFERHDVLVTPTVHEPAPELAWLDPTALGPYELLERMVPHMAFTEPWNTTGQPAITLPLAATDEGLPVGVQLVGAPGREDHLLSLSALLLGEAPARTPRIHA
jgi:amidase